MVKLALLNALVASAVLVSARPSKRASCTINSVDSASDISDCSSVTINAFTVPSGKTLTLKVSLYRARYMSLALIAYVAC